MEDDDKKEKKKYPSLPSNYVTLVQLQERWLNEKKRKQKEKEDKEAEEERQRKLQLQKLEEEEEEHKRKLERQGLKEVDGINQQPTRWNQRRSGRAVEMNIANPIAVDIGNLTTEPEQNSEEPKEKQKKKPSEEKEVSDGTAQAPHVTSEEEINARVRRKGESEGRRREFRPKRENAERTAEIEQKFGESSTNCGTEKVNERATRPRTGMHGGNREYRGCGRFGGRREVVKQSGRAVEMSIANPVAVDTGNRTTEPEQKSEEPKEKKKKKKKKRTWKKEKIKPSEEKEKEVSDGTAQAPHVIREEENAPVRRNGESEGRRSEYGPRRENADRTAEIEHKFGEFSMNGGNEKVNERATRPRTRMHGGIREYRGCGRFGDRWEVVKRSGREVGMSIANPVAVDAGNRTIKPEQKSEEPKEKKKRTKKEKMKQREEMEEEVSDSTAQAPHLISEEENAPVRRKGELEGRRSEYRPRRENAEQAAEIEQEFGDFSMNGGNEKVNERVARPRTGMHGGNREYLGYGGFSGRRDVVKQSGAAMVWVRKGDLSNGLRTPLQLNILDNCMCHLLLWPWCCLAGKMQVYRH